MVEPDPDCAARPRSTDTDRDRNEQSPIWRRAAERGRAGLRRVRWRLWDAYHGIDTGGGADGDVGFTVGENSAYTHHYEASGSGLRRQLARLQLDYGRYGFIDFGSGKGRALLMAAEFPFAFVMSVEFAQDLHLVAERNIERYVRGARRCESVRSILADAVSFPLPETPLVLYFYNPLSGPVLGAVLAYVQRSLSSSPRDCIIIAGGRWTERAQFNRLPAARLIAEDGSFVTYDLGPP
jgi:hypothetical protein